VTLDDPAAVRAEYASEVRLEGRRAAYRYATGPDAREIAFEAIAEFEPRRVLEVGCGPGELSARVQDELGAEVKAVDLSERMVELTRRRGVDAQVADVQELPFADGEFDCAVAAWMLYHVPDVDRALSELARVLRSRGRLVAVTNAPEHLRELAELLGAERPRTSFDGGNAEEQLLRRFARVERREAFGTVDFPSRTEAQSYVDSSIIWLELARGPLPAFEGPLRVTCAPVVFVAMKA
jgi:SAM-dependent methyltransferase